MRLVLVLLLIVTVSGCGGGVPEPPGSATGAVGFTNPVYDHDFPDPMIIDAGDGNYLAVATNGNGRNVQTLTSRDLVTWRSGGDALPDLPTWSAPGDVWAPEVSKHSDGRYLLYYTTRAVEAGVQCIGVAAAAKAAGPYVDRSSGPLVCQRGLGGSIDPHPFMSSDGTRYLYWKNDGNAIGADTSIWVQRLDASGTGLVGRPTALIHQELSWEGAVVEAPFVWEHDGRFHLFYSANAYDSADYGVGEAVSDSPTGPFVKDEVPILVGNAVAAGPGHCALFAKDGRIWMAYHAWRPEAIGAEDPGRTMWLSEVTFTDGRASVVQPTVDYPVRP